MAVDPLRLIGIAETIVDPIQRIFARVLPDFIEERLDDPEVRERIVAEADKALVKEVPGAGLTPDDIRKKIIRRLLDVVLDDILLPD